MYSISMLPNHCGDALKWEDSGLEDSLTSLIAIAMWSIEQYEQRSNVFHEVVRGLAPASHPCVTYARIPRSSSANEDHS